METKNKEKENKQHQKSIKQLEKTIVQKKVEVTEELDSLRIDNLDPDCVICLEKFDKGNHFHCALTSCGHRFGESCIRKVLDSTEVCPVCNADFEEDNILRLF